MKCPGCQFVASDQRDICPKCLLDLRAHKEVMGIEVRHPDLSYNELLDIVTGKKKKSKKKSSFFGSLFGGSAGESELKPAEEVDTPAKSKTKKTATEDGEVTEETAPEETVFEQESKPEEHVVSDVEPHVAEEPQQEKKSLLGGLFGKAEDAIDTAALTEPAQEVAAPEPEEAQVVATDEASEPVVEEAIEAAAAIATEPVEQDRPEEEKGSFFGGLFKKTKEEAASIAAQQVEEQISKEVNALEAVVEETTTPGKTEITENPASKETLEERLQEAGAENEASASREENSEGKKSFFDGLFGRSEEPAPESSDVVGTDIEIQANEQDESQTLEEAPPAKPAEQEKTLAAEETPEGKAHTGTPTAIVIEEAAPEEESSPFASLLRVQDEASLPPAKELCFFKESKDIEKQFKKGLFKKKASEPAQLFLSLFGRLTRGPAQTADETTVVDAPELHEQLELCFDPVEEPEFIRDDSELYFCEEIKILNKIESSFLTKFKKAHNRPQQLYLQLYGAPLEAPTKETVLSSEPEPVEEAAKHYQLELDFSPRPDDEEAAEEEDTTHDTISEYVRVVKVGEDKEPPEEPEVKALKPGGFIFDSADDAFLDDEPLTLTESPELSPVEEEAAQEEQEESARAHGTVLDSADDAFPDEQPLTMAAVADSSASEEKIAQEETDVNKAEPAPETVAALDIAALMQKLETPEKARERILDSSTAENAEAAELAATDEKATDEPVTAEVATAETNNDAPVETVYSLDVEIESVEPDSTEQLTETLETAEATDPEETDPATETVYSLDAPASETADDEALSQEAEEISPADTDSDPEDQGAPTPPPAAPKGASLDDLMAALGEETEEDTSESDNTGEPVATTVQIPEGEISASFVVPADELHDSAIKETELSKDDSALQAENADDDDLSSMFSYIADAAEETGSIATSIGEEVADEARKQPEEIDSESAEDEDDDFDPPASGGFSAVSDTQSVVSDTGEAVATRTVATHIPLPAVDTAAIEQLFNSAETDIVSCESSFEVTITPDYSSVEYEKILLLFDLAKDFFIEPEKEYVELQEDTAAIKVVNTELEAALEKVEAQASAPLFSLKKGNALSPEATDTIGPAAITERKIPLIQPSSRQFFTALAVDALAIALWGLMLFVFYTKTYEPYYWELLREQRALRAGDGIGLFVISLTTVTTCLTSYVFLMFALFHSTFGMDTAKLQIAHISGRRLRGSEHLTRSLIVSASALFFGWLPLLNGKRALHDRITNSTVVRLVEEEEATTDSTDL